MATSRVTVLFLLLPIVFGEELRDDEINLKLKRVFCDGTWPAVDKMFEARYNCSKTVYSEFEATVANICFREVYNADRDMLSFSQEKDIICSDGNFVRTTLYCEQQLGMNRINFTERQGRLIECAEGELAPLWNFKLSVIANCFNWTAAGSRKMRCELENSVSVSAHRVSVSLHY